MGFLKKFLAGGKERSSGDQMDANKLQEIIESYGQSLEAKAKTTFSVADESKLPYTKSEIKKAIIIALSVTEDPQLKEHLKISYINLSDWQKGVGEEDMLYDIDVTGFDLNASAEDLAQKVTDQEKGMVKKWKAVVNEDRLLLQEELVKMGLW